MYSAPKIGIVGPMPTSGRSNRSFLWNITLIVIHRGFLLLFLVIFETWKNLLLSLVGLSSAEPFWKYDRPERFVKWATEAIPQIIAEGVRDGLDWKSCAN